MTMPHRDHYPQHLADVLDPPVCFKRQTLAAIRRFARSKPWRGNQHEREAKFAGLHSDLRSVYRKTTELRFGILDGTGLGVELLQPVARRDRPDRSDQRRYLPP